MVVAWFWSCLFPPPSYPASCPHRQLQAVAPPPSLLRVLDSNGIQQGESLTRTQDLRITLGLGSGGGVVPEEVWVASDPHCTPALASEEAFSGLRVEVRANPGCQS